MPMTDPPASTNARRRHQKPSVLVTTVRHFLSGRVCLPVPARFSYDHAAPYEVTLTLLPAGSASVTWRLSRELLRSGTRALSGVGDVRVWPRSAPGPEGSVRLRLGSRGAYALFEADRAVLRRWLERTYALVPAETEYQRVDWDVLVRRLRSGN
jgi:hypothetical protein